MHGVADLGIMNQHIKECKMAAVSRCSITRPFSVFGTARSSCRRASRCDDTRSPSAAQARRRDLLIVPLLACTIHAAPRLDDGNSFHAYWLACSQRGLCCLRLAPFHDLCDENKCFVTEIHTVQAVKQQASRQYHPPFSRMSPAQQAKLLKPSNQRQRPHQTHLRSLTS